MINKSSSAIIDKHSANVLLALAAKEKLIWTIRETDGVFEKIIATEYNPILVHQLRERMVVSPKVVFHDFPDFLWDALDGPLKDNGHIAKIETTTSEEIRFKSIPLGVISGLIGRPVSDGELHETMENARAALAEERDFENTSGRKPPNILQEMLGGMLKNPSQYTEEEINAQKARNSVYSTCMPFVKALEEYSALANVATKYGILLGTPLLASDTAASIINPNFVPQDHDSEVVLFRVVCNELGRTPFRSTLEGTLQLSQEPATKALREMLHIWHSRLACGDEQELRKVKLEIAQATEALRNLDSVRTAGRVTTWLAIPVALFELVMSIPPIIGVTVSSIGIFAIDKEQRVQQQYLWATYGGT